MGPSARADGTGGAEETAICVPGELVSETKGLLHPGFRLEEGPENRREPQVSTQRGKPARGLK